MVLQVLMRMAHSLYTRCVAAANSQLEAREWASLGVLRRQMQFYSVVFAVCWLPGTAPEWTLLASLCRQRLIEMFSLPLGHEQCSCGMIDGVLNALVYRQQTWLKFAIVLDSNTFLLFTELVSCDGNILKKCKACILVLLVS